MQQVALNGSEVWAYFVESDDGMRIRFQIDDWQRLGLSVGQRIPLRMRGEVDVWLFVTDVIEQPPVVWVTMVRRMREAG